MLKSNSYPEFSASFTFAQMPHVMLQGPVLLHHCSYLSIADLCLTFNWHCNSVTFTIRSWVDLQPYLPCSCKRNRFLLSCQRSFPIFYSCLKFGIQGSLFVIFPIYSRRSSQNKWHYNFSNHQCQSSKCSRLIFHCCVFHQHSISCHCWWSKTNCDATLCYGIPLFHFLWKVVYTDNHRICEWHHSRKWGFFLEATLNSYNYQSGFWQERDL